MRRRRRFCSSPSRRRPPLPYFSVPDYIDTALVGPRAGLSPSATVVRMAEDMREAEYREGGVTEQDLIGRGYTAAQVKTHGADARALAQLLAGASL